ncbi:SDR family NAD(P)-dependent oxidoreductase [Paenibacillus xylanexedens]|uniref:SDR family NAD(P)-dependent oxidoreductase n=1 Tax=Paenibacillus xylanexedens TaxID=528191 RepID=UPI003B01D2B2
MRKGLMGSIKLDDLLESGAESVDIESVSTKDIAIIGMSGRFPGAEELEVYWSNLVNGVDSISDFPAERQSFTDYYMKTRGESVAYTKAGFLNHIDRFDYRFFNLSPREASLMDPNQRLFLETAWHAIENSGYGGGKLKGSNTGVYVGFRNDEVYDYKRLITDLEPQADPSAVPGNLASILASRISYLLDLKGPSLCLDTACSSSLVAIHLASQAIRNGDCDLAVAGGVKIRLFPLDEGNKLGVEAPDGKVKAFDADSDGTVWGEGAAAIILKPLNKALRDRDHIYAVIKGSAVNQDGTSVGITAPNTASQTDLLVKAWKNAGINPETLNYIETHGTGTDMGDPIEFEAIRRAFQKFTNKKQFCAIGSVKTNVGHLDCVAGMASLFKVIMGMREGMMPPTLHFQRQNSKINFEDSPVYLNTRPRIWHAEGAPRRCGVSAFGLSGTNSHIVVEEPPRYHRADTAVTPDMQILTISAKSAASLTKLVHAYQVLLVSDLELSLADLSFSANTGRGHYTQRLAITYSDRKDLERKLKLVSDVKGGPDLEINGVHTGIHRIITAGEGESTRSTGEITEQEVKLLGQKAQGWISEAHLHPREVLLEAICDLYVQGADVSWEDLYREKSVRRIPLPSYQFEPNICWLDWKSDMDQRQTDDMYRSMYRTRWIADSLEPSILDEEQQPIDDGITLILRKDKDLEGERLETTLRNLGRKLVSVTFDGDVAVMEGLSGLVQLSSEDVYDHLLGALPFNDITRVIHLLSSTSRMQVHNLADLSQAEIEGPLSLFRLVKSLVQRAVSGPVDISIATTTAYQVTGDEVELYPEHAALIGWAKVIGKEYPHIRCQCIDRDAHSSLESIPELVGGIGISNENFAYRNGIRYVEQLDEWNTETQENSDWQLVEDGVYIITGGAGGIGSEIGRWMAGQAKVRIVLLGRTELPNREQWPLLRKNGKDQTAVQQIIREIDAMESLGAMVTYFSVDVSDEMRLTHTLDDIRQTFGSIRGIVHCAGTGSDLSTDQKSEDDVKRTLAPKIRGTWLLDQLTRQDQPDFMLLCSSIATTFSTLTMGDYVAANAYLDTFAAQRTKQGLHTLAINWVTWRERGMAARSGFTADTIFKAILPEQAIHTLADVVTQKVDRVIIGELNIDGGGIPLLERSGIRVAPHLLERLKRLKSTTRSIADMASTRSLSQHGTGQVILTGKEKEDYTEAERRVADVCRQVLGFEEINIHENFFELGADSLLLKTMHARLELLDPGSLMITDLFEHATVYKLARFLVDKRQGSNNMTHHATMKGTEQDIAIIGISVKLPNANTTDEFWDNIRNGLDCRTALSAERKDAIDRYIRYKQFPEGSVALVEGSYIDEIDKFDSTFFRLSPKEASLMDPHQRLFLQACWEAVEDAGCVENISGSYTGVFVGYSPNIRDMYSRLIYETNPTLLSSAMVGNTAAVTSGRVSYMLDLKGPSMVVDTACSSSLVAVDAACQSIRSGKCEMAIAGGIKIHTMPIHHTNTRMGIGMESMDGITRAFDEESEGTGFGEGIGVIMLKPLEKAKQDGDQIYAVIKGSASNQDGSSAGMTAPNPAAQEDVIRKAWDDAGIDPATIGYVEAHGTGTPLGDPIEVNSLTNAFRMFTDKRNFCAIGSVKANMGHLLEAAGIVGLIKTALALKNKELPATIHFNRPNENIPFYDSAIYVNTVTRKWEVEGHPRRAGVSAFGMSGTNAHIVLEEPPADYTHKEPPDHVPHVGPQLFMLSAKSRESLQQLVTRYVAYSPQLLQMDLQDICYTVQAGRSHYPHRLIFAVNTTTELVCCLNELNRLYFWESELGDTGKVFYRYGEHRLVSGTDGIRRPDDLTLVQKESLNAEIQEVALAWRNGLYRDESMQVKISDLYSTGADLPPLLWNDGQAPRKVRLPVYAFERKTHWLDIPDVAPVKVERMEQPFHVIRWVNTPSNDGTSWMSSESGDVLLFTGKTALSASIYERLLAAGRKVVRVEIGLQKDSTPGDGWYGVDSNKQAYEDLLTDLQSEYQFTHIIHMSTTEQAVFPESIEQLEVTQQRGARSLMYLTQALAHVGYERGLSLTLVSDYVNEVTGNERVLQPQQAPFMGMGRVVGQELMGISCKFLDVDDVVSAEDVLQEIGRKSDLYLVAYREGTRYEEQFETLNDTTVIGHAPAIQNDGVYVITGGTKGIGLEVTQYLADKGAGHVALLARSPFPPRDQWTEWLDQNRDREVCETINRVMDLEKKGTSCSFYQVDIGHLDRLREVFDELRQNYGPIRGVVHSAGVPGEGMLMRKTEEQFSAVIGPKVHGTWALDQVTLEDNLDFFLLFSTISSVFAAPGQGDYAAANAYLDAFAAYRSKLGKRTLTMNWNTWRDTGMGVRYGINVDGVFSAIPTEQGIAWLDRAMGMTLNRVIVGEINRESKLLGMMSSVAVRLSDDLRSLATDEKTVFPETQNQTGYAEVTLDGRTGEGAYSDAEDMIAKIFGSVLGFSEINIYDSFFELGGDSIMLGQMHELLDRHFPNKIKLVDLFEYTTVDKLSNYIAGNEQHILQAAPITSASEEQDGDWNDSLSHMLDKLQDGEVSVEDILHRLDEIRPGE